MAKTTRALTAKFVHSVTAPGKYYDQHGLFIPVYPTGAKCWQQRLTFRGRRRTLGLGGYPTVTLREARLAALENKRTVHCGDDPFQLRQRPAVPTFAQAAAIVVESRRRNWTAARTGASWTRSFVQHVFPRIGDLAVSGIQSSDILGILSPIWTVKRDLARKLYWRIRIVMDWAVAHKYIAENPAGDAIRGALPSNYVKPCGPVFPTAAGDVRHSDPIGRVLRQLDVPGVPHGFRSSFRDWCGETGVPRALAELAFDPERDRLTGAGIPRLDRLTILHVNGRRIRASRFPVDESS